MKILLCDDSVTIRMIMKGLLKQLQLTDVVEACDGQAALATLKTHKIDLLILDIHMPNMDGLECLRQIKKSPQLSHVPVVILSSDTAASQLEAAAKLGACAFMPKPFQLEGLRRAISESQPIQTAP